MFTNKNKISNQNTYYRQNRKQNYGFSCGGGSNQSTIRSSNQSSNGTGSGMFSSLHKELNNNINLINRENTVMGSMFRKNSMFPKKRGCGCGGRK